jgi:hypothetical protein
LQHEYQEYVLAHRVRSLLGGRLEPSVALLSLNAYATRRIERQRAARELITVKPLTPQRLAALDALTDELCFGHWRNPREINDFLLRAWRMGGHVVLESESEFAAQVLTPTERERLPQRGLEVARFFHACLRVGAAALNPDEMEVAVNRVERMAAGLPVFLDALAVLQNGDYPPDLSWLEED